MWMVDSGWWKVELHVLANFGFGNVELAAGDGGGQLTGGENGATMREPEEHGAEVGFLDHLEVLVGGGALGTDNAGAGVIHGNALTL